MKKMLFFPKHVKTRKMEKNLCMGILPLPMHSEEDVVPVRRVV